MNYTHINTIKREKKWHSIGGKNKNKQTTNVDLTLTPYALMEGALASAVPMYISAACSYRLIFIFLNSQQ